MKVVSFKICPFFQQVLAVLEAKNIPHEVEFTDFDNCLFEVSPNGKAPILITDDGVTLFDSDAIISYLEATYPEKDTSVTNEERALERGWRFQASKNYVAQCSAMRSETSESFASLTQVFQKALVKVEANLGNTEFFNGSKLGNVDIAWLPILHRATLIEKHTGYDFFENFPRIKAWQQNVMKLNLVEKSVSGDFEKIFTDFYLPSSSYLGSLKHAA
jgi:glutathione S-transferase